LATLLLLDALPTGVESTHPQNNKGETPMTLAGTIRCAAAALIATLLLSFVAFHGFDAVVRVTAEQMRLPSGEQLHGPPAHKIIVPLI
jgi:amino acid transporter